MINNFSHYMHNMIYIERLELLYYTIIAVIIGFVIGICVIIVSTKKPAMIIMTEKQEAGENIRETDIKDLNAMAKFLDPFDESTEQKVKNFKKLV